MMISYDDIKSGRAAVPAEKPAKTDPNTIPSLIVRAAQRLSEAKSSAEVLEAKAAAELALHYAKVTKAANESHADCLRIITRAEIRMASEIDRGQEAGEVAKRGRKENVPASDNKATMAELGVSRQRVNEWRKVAEAGEDKVEEAISDALAEGRAPTKADVHRAAGIVKNKPKSDEDQQFDDLQRAWNAAGQGARARFLAAIELTESTEQPTAAARVSTPVANTRGQTGTADRPARSPVPASAKAVAKKVGQSGQEAAIELPVDTVSPSAATSADTVALASQAPRPDATVPLSNPQPTSSPDADMAGEPQDGNEPVSGSPASVTKLTALSKADQIRLLRPHCRHADDLDKCGGVGAKHCSVCKKIAAESEAA